MVEEHETEENNSASNYVDKGEEIPIEDVDSVEVECYDEIIKNRK